MRATLGGRGGGAAGRGRATTDARRLPAAAVARGAWGGRPPESAPHGGGRGEGHRRSRCRAWWQGERRVARRLAALDQQAEAVRLALTEKVLVLTGGPGVGKTTVTRAIVEVFEQSNCQVLLASPTGRAAKRLSEVTGRPGEDHPPAAGDRPDDRGSSAATSSNPLEADVVIVDESSMMDVELMHALVRAVPDQAARLILVGDVDQLPSVGPGLVLRDMIDSHAVPVARLTEIFRQDRESQIVMNAYRVNAGQTPEFNLPPAARGRLRAARRERPGARSRGSWCRWWARRCRGTGFPPCGDPGADPHEQARARHRRAQRAAAGGPQSAPPGLHEVRRGEKLPP